jgi:hypothetical protein
MARSTTSPLDRQLARVRRRLFLQQLLDLLAWGWVTALVLAAGWFLAEPYALKETPPWSRWGVLGGAVGLASFLAGVLAWLRRPSAVEAALSLDERFGLKERVTTTLTLGPGEADSPAGQALLADVNSRLEPLRVGDRFPVRVPWAAGLVPVGGVLLVLLAFFYKPLVGSTQAQTPEALAPTPAVQAEIDQKLSELKKGRARGPDERPKSGELERLEAELDKLARQPHDTREQAREVVKNMTTLEDEIRKREQELARRADALKEQMKQVERLSKKGKDGPARNLDRALKEGDYRKARDEADRLRKKFKAREEADRLRKKLRDRDLTEQQKQEIRDQLDRLKDQELSREDREKLEEQLKNLQDKLERLTRREEQEKLLREKERKGEISKEELDRELEQLAKYSEQLSEEELKELRELAEKLGECQECLKEGKDGEAARKLGELAAKLARMQSRDKGEGKELARKLAQLRAARQVMCRALNNRAGQASGRRPESKEGPTQYKEEQVRSELDRGQLQVVDQVPGEGFKGPRQPGEMAEEIRQAAQEAPEALDRQRLPRSASDMARGYFEKLRGPDKGGPNKP